MSAVEEHTEAATISRRGTVVSDVVITAVWFLVAGALGALVWWHFTDLPRATRENGQVVIDSVELLKQVNADAWFFVVAAVGGLVSGIVLLTWRTRDALLMVVLVTLGGLLAALVTLKLGLWLGPGSEVQALRSKPNGGTALMQLKLHAPGMFWIWPIASALGALLQLWVLRPPDRQSPASADETPHNA